MVAFLFKICIAVTIAFGVLMLVAPKRYRMLLSRIAGASEEGTVLGPSRYHAGDSSEIRLAGLLIVLGCSFILWQIATFHRTPENQTSEQKIAANSKPASTLLDVIAGLTLVGAGAYIVQKPGTIVRWNVRVLSRRGVVSDEKLKEWRIGARVLGGTAILAGIIILYYSLIST